MGLKISALKTTTCPRLNYTGDSTLLPEGMNFIPSLMPSKQRQTQWPLAPRATFFWVDFRERSTHHLSSLNYLASSSNMEVKSITRTVTELHQRSNFTQLWAQNLNCKHEWKMLNGFFGSYGSSRILAYHGCWASWLAEFLFVLPIFSHRLDISFFYSQSSRSKLVAVISVDFGDSEYRGRSWLQWLRTFPLDLIHYMTNLPFDSI